MEQLLLLFGTLAFIIITSAYFKWHPLFSLVSGAIAFGLLTGMPANSLLETVTMGFGKLVGTIGLIVVLGSILGTVLEESGSVQRVGVWLAQRAGRSPSLGMALLGMVLGIPVFCDSGFILLISLARSWGLSSGVPAATMSLSLAGGLYTTHTLVPPTPGPVAAAGNLGMADSLGLVMLLGIVVSIPVVWVAHAYAKRVGRTWVARDEAPAREVTQLPSGSMGPTVMLLTTPLILIGLASVLRLLGAEGTAVECVLFVGHPMIALLLTVVVGLFLFRRQGKSRTWVEAGVRQAGPILLLTGCGGALGAVLQASELATVTRLWAQEQAFGGISFLLFAFALSAFFKTAQGSSTSALVIVSSLLAPLASGFSQPLAGALLVLAMGAGAMTVSHANDSYFWVVSQFGGLDVRSSYRGWTVITFLQGAVALAMIVLLYFLLI